ncbi:MAG: DUF4124 domain-containing protein [Rhizobacter sp.]|nr:DUF4124 domain-containing protein [Rhizobacter sp.]
MPSRVDRLCARQVDVRAAFAAFAIAVAATGAVAANQIYTCTDASGKKLTSDRPIDACSSREQRELNADGSVRRIVPPTPTSDERAEIEARERDAVAERSRRQEAIRRDRNLLARFPDEAAHRKARTAALDDVRKALRVSEERVALLTAERKPLMDEAEFYVGKALPGKLRSQLDANDASTEAQRTLAQNQQLEIVRVNKLYDAELERLKKLWAGAQPGSLGGSVGAAVAAGPPSAPRK